MEERSSHLTVVVGASTLAEDLRRSLAKHGVAHAGIATHLRGLRRSMVMGENDLVVVCIALDRTTLERHGESVRKLLADCQCFPQSVRSVGLLTEIGLTNDVAQMGCDVYAHDSSQAARAVRMLARRWQTQNQPKTVKKQVGRSKESKARLADAWIWGETKATVEFAPWMDAKGAQAIANASHASSDSEKSRRGSTRGRQVDDVSGRKRSSKNVRRCDG